MCGLTGFLDLSGQTGPTELRTRVAQMTHTLHHRGPDNGDVWVDVVAGLALGHRRLAIIDLSPEGRQPMHSADGRYVIVFNGEIYNFELLRPELVQRGHSFRGHSDTEVMLAAISEWGLPAAVKKFIGMFAFVLWDRQERTLSLVRDRLGIKPLYYGWVGQTFLFGSELKALCAHPHFTGQVNRDVLALYLRHGYVPTPYSIYQGIGKLPAGTILTVRAAEPTAPLTPVSYWSLKEVAERSLTRPFEGSTDEAAMRLDTLLRDAVKLRMVADVPLGTFLSGGLDSSTVVALMQAQSERPVKTFTIGFYEAGYNEAENARAVAQHLGTEHTELYLTPDQALGVIPRLPTLYDEPFADASQIPTFLVSELTRQYVTVSLSGDGGDELFAGYKWYFRGENNWRRLSRIPSTLKRVAAKSLTTLSPDTWEILFRQMAPVLLHKIKSRNLNEEKPYHLAEVLQIEQPELFYAWLISHWKHPAVLLSGAQEPLTVLTDRSRWANLPDFMHRMMYLDTALNLPDAMLTKVDRASMGVSLEVRVPLLDHRVVEFAWRLPLSMKVKNGQSKWLLRRILNDYVPAELIERPKQGFSVPIAAWLRGPLRDWAEALLAERRLREEGYFQPHLIRQKWSEHLSGKYNWYYYLWDVLMFQAWLDEWGSG